MYEVFLLVVSSFRFQVYQAERPETSGEAHVCKASSVFKSTSTPLSVTTVFKTEH
ncbi:hypothetical protein RB619_14415 [Flavobacterium sp. LHD-80]|uniref:hypothetical protein n=1 Tax=Flavobacterium sp. LHD-80 TaxID=3071411 RepID=UPI0027E143D4|nr:hypothetical protein [Flavobacterium sp. LHD-80]MDQ6471846.1 hypothetical protein [Flavobacterium sp. LHD-80]